MIELINENDLIIEATRQLLANLNGNILSSNITNYILEYLSILDAVISEDQEKYSRFYNNILHMLEEQGWVRTKER